MIDKLTAIYSRYEQLEEQLGNPDLVSDLSRYKKVNKEYKDLKTEIDETNSIDMKSKSVKKGSGFHNFKNFYFNKFVSLCGLFNFLLELPLMNTSFKYQIYYYRDHLT